MYPPKMQEKNPLPAKHQSDNQAIRVFWTKLW